MMVVGSGWGARDGRIAVLVVVEAVVEVSDAVGMADAFVWIDATEVRRRRGTASLAALRVLSRR